MKGPALAICLVLASAAAPAAAICPLEARLRAEPHWAHRDQDNCELCIFNSVRVGPGSNLRWNGVRIDRTTLGQYLGMVSKMHPLPITELQV